MKKVFVTRCAYCDQGAAQYQPKPGEEVTHGICPTHFFVAIFEIGLYQEQAAREAIAQEMQYPPYLAKAIQKTKQAIYGRTHEIQH